MQVIYEPQGRAGEFAPLAANLYRGCGHGCSYCYVPMVIKTKRDIFSKQPFPVGVALKPSSLSVSKGGDLNIKAFFLNNTNQFQTVQFVTSAKLPNGDPYPPSGYLYGPVQVDIGPYALTSETFYHTIPTNAPSGTYTYKGYIGTPSATLIDKYLFDFEIL